MTVNTRNKRKTPTSSCRRKNCADHRRERSKGGSSRGVKVKGEIIGRRGDRGRKERERGEMRRGRGRVEEGQLWGYVFDCESAFSLFRTRIFTLTSFGSKK